MSYFSSPLNSTTQTELFQLSPKFSYTNWASFLSSVLMWLGFLTVNSATYVPEICNKLCKSVTDILREEILICVTADGIRNTFEQEVITLCVLLCCSCKVRPVISDYAVTSSPIITAIVTTREQAGVLYALRWRCNNTLSLKAVFGWNLTPCSESVTRWRKLISSPEPVMNMHYTESQY